MFLVMFKKVLLYNFEMKLFLFASILTRLTKTKCKTNSISSPQPYTPPKKSNETDFYLWMVKIFEYTKTTVAPSSNTLCTFYVFLPFFLSFLLSLSLSSCFSFSPFLFFLAPSFLKCESCQGHNIFKCLSIVRFACSIIFSHFYSSKFRHMHKKTVSARNFLGMIIKIM
jgi:hypothetical protein